MQKLCIVFILLALGTVVRAKDSSCKNEEYACKTQTECIPISKLCDGIPDCFDSSDETIHVCQNISCPQGSFHCAYGGCVSRNASCNGVRDCIDNSDESQCPTFNVTNTCETGQFSCLGGGCIPIYRVCDGKPNCLDSSDETLVLCESQSCPSGAFQCSYGACIEPELVCDGKPDCADYSDETLARCKTKLSVPSNGICGSDRFRCASGLCINSSRMCDGHRHCDDGSDETSRLCQNTTCENPDAQCAYGACIPNFSECSFILSCVDESDCYPRSSFPNTPQTGGSFFGGTGGSFSGGSGGGFPGSGYHPGVSTLPPLLPPQYEPSGDPPLSISSDQDYLKCFIPLKPPNGDYIMSVKMPDEPFGLVPKWTVIKYSCNGKYILDSDEYRICFDGVWNKPDPLCLETCPPLISESLDITCTRNDQEVDCNQLMIEGTIATIKCKPSFEVPTVVPYHGIKCSRGKWDYDLYQCIPVCGTAVPRGQTLVIRGYEAYKGEYPWHIGIYAKTRLGEDQICGGTLISPGVVLSAAHCFWDFTERKKKNACLYAVAAGKFYRSWRNKHDTHAQFRDVKLIEMPKRFRGEESSYANDIAIVVVSDPFKITSVVRPICVDWSNELREEQLHSGSKGVVAGWGITSEDGESAEKLQTAILPFVEYDDCIDTFPATFRPFVTDDKICAGHTNGTSVCVGDSGGGLAFAKRNRYFIQGVVSVAPSKSASCDSYQYAAFTSVSSHLRWIKQQEISHRP